MLVRGQGQELDEILAERHLLEERARLGVVAIELRDLLLDRVLDEEVAKLDGDYTEARALFEQVALGEEFVEFLTLPAYERID